MQAQRSILLVFLDLPLESSGELLRELSSAAKLTVAKTMADTISQLATRPNAVVIGDAGIHLEKHHHLVQTLLAYCTAGGILVFASQFAGFSRVDHFDVLMGKLGVPWRYGTYVRTTVALNAASELARSTSGMPARFSIKAVHLKGVRREHCVYLPAEGARVQSHVFPADLITERDQTPVAFMPLSQGLLGFIGDVNSQEESGIILRHMCCAVGTSAPPPPTHTAQQQS